MKKLFVFLLTALLLAGCSEAAPTAETAAPETISPAATTVPETQTEPANQIFSQEMAMIEGYLVMQDGDVRHNQKNWFSFVKACESGEPASMKAAHYAYTGTGLTCTLYSVEFDGNEYCVTYTRDGETEVERYAHLVLSWCTFDDSMEPYDACQRYTLSNNEEGTDGIILYEDLIANPDYSGVTEIRLHAKEGEPPVKTYTGIDTEAVLALLEGASYLPCPPEEYAYCMKLIMVNGEGKEIGIELEMNSGICRYGMQVYEYGSLADMFAVLGMEDWPESVKEEFGAYIG